MAFVEPDTVTIRSGHEPSDIFIFAPDCKKKRETERMSERKTKIGYMKTIRKK
jgi:hypothetical protein